MSEPKTVQRRIRPITIRCGIPGCTTKPQDAVASEQDDAPPEIIAPRGWTFPPSAVTTGDTVVGRCPAHDAKPKA